MNKKYNKNNINSNYIDKKIDEDENYENLHSPMRIHFPEKIHMKTKTIEDTKYVIPPLDLSKTKKGANSNINKNNNNIKSNLKPDDKDQLRKKNFDDLEEWQETIKVVGLSNEEIDRFFNNKMLHKLIYAIENLIKIICEKNEKLKYLKEENMDLSSQHTQIKNEQINLAKSFILLKEKNKLLEMHISKIEAKEGEVFDTSMVNIFPFDQQKF